MARTPAKGLSASLEDYLEAIFQIVEAKQAVRAKDISARMDVGKSSVTGALHALKDKGLINYAPYDVITLTEKGRSIAEQVAGRHKIFRDFLVTVLGVEEEEAETAACKAEHAMSGAILRRLGQFVEFLEQFPGGSEKWLEMFRRYCDDANEHGDGER